MAEREFEAVKERIAGKRTGFRRVSCINASLPLSQISSLSEELCAECKVGYFLSKTSFLLSFLGFFFCFPIFAAFHLAYKCIELLGSMLTFQTNSEPQEMPLMLIC